MCSRLGLPAYSVLNSDALLYADLFYFVYNDFILPTIILVFALSQDLKIRFYVTIQISVFYLKNEKVPQFLLGQSRLGINRACCL